ncbi:MAG: Flagellar motor rotation protein MotB [Labilithrix sp.]|nr:Flagellar motor rotation protein MotB [Labilithrix sp.]
MTTKKIRRSLLGAALATAAFAGSSAAPRDAAAQTKTFHLDRLEVPGGPEDGITLFRPQNNPRNIFFGQLALGYQLRPLKVRNVTQDTAVLARTDRTAVVQDALTVYGNVGFQILERVTLALSFPWSPVQDGANPNYGTGNIQGPGQNGTTPITTGGPTAGDLRVDLRGTLFRSEDRKSAFGAQISVFGPTGTKTDLGSDNGAGALLMVTGERQVKFVTLVANLGYHFRKEHIINDPANDSGLGIGNEIRWGVGGFVPLKDGKYRVGASIFGSTGGQPDNDFIGHTFFRKENTPIEWNVEGRMKFGPADHWWAGFGGGTRLGVNAYGAPDLRLIAMLGAYVPILDTDPKSPERRAEQRARWREAHISDRDHDGVPDDIDACPDEAEDHLGNDPNDGCPMPPDKDGDGIPDQYDKCPDVPEDKDGIDDGDGCPEDDADQDGIPDVQDACPKEPGQRSTDPKKNGCPSFIKVEGNVVRIMQQVHFATGSATILPESFPMLNEIAMLLKANKGIKRMSIDGHTDNRGAAEMNKKLSGDRAASVMSWLVGKGVEQTRLESHGYGLERPIEPNDTDAGRAANRRVEFKIVDEEDSNAVRKN